MIEPFQVRLLFVWLKTPPTNTAVDDLRSPDDLRGLRERHLWLSYQVARCVFSWCYETKANTCAGVRKVEANLKDQLVFVEGNAPPSSIVSAIQGTGRDAILRGSGTSNSTPLSFPCDPCDL